MIKHKGGKFLTNLLIFFLLVYSLFFFIPSFSHAQTEELLDSQTENLGISDFLKEAEKYTQEEFEDINPKDLFESAIKGDIDNETIAKKIFSLLGKEVKESVTVLRQYSSHYCDS